MLISDFEMVIGQGDTVLQCTTEKPLIVRGDVYRPQYVFRGVLDEVVIFNRVLAKRKLRGLWGY